MQLGEVEPQLSVSQDTRTAQTSASSPTLANDAVDGRKRVRTVSADAYGEDARSAKLQPRQTETAGSSVLSQSSRSSISATSLPSATTTQTASLSDGGSSIVTSEDPAGTGAPSDGTLISVGDYACSTQLDFHRFLEVLYGHLVATEDNLNATTKYVILNLHAAASASEPSEAASSPSEDDLPQGANLLSSLLSTNNSQYLYTPQLLSDQRADLNKPGSWFTVREPMTPDFSFYTVNRSTNAIQSTPDGWPSESVVEFARARRMLAGFGRIDPQMRAYDFSLDASTIFPPGYLQDNQDVSFSSNGSVTSGCIIDTDDPSIATSNSSWATTSNLGEDPSSDTSFDIRLARAGNLTDCGISPVLNSTLRNSSADTDPQAYKSYAMSTIWSWAEGEPRSPDTSEQDGPSDIANRCAVLNATSSRWQSHECGNPHHAACRLKDRDPYDFRISDSSAAYSKAENACRGDVSFAAPRTSVENSFLASAWRQYRSEYDIEDELLWLDVNDLDIARCWVIGQNSTCPYQEQQVGGDRKIVVPTVAAVIVFVLAILTIFIKCASNRRNTKRRRKRVDDGWDYEGVPS